MTSEHTWTGLWHKNSNGNTWIKKGRKSKKGEGWRGSKRRMNLLYQNTHWILLNFTKSSRAIIPFCVHHVHVIFCNNHHLLITTISLSSLLSIVLHHGPEMMFGHLGEQVTGGLEIIVISDGLADVLGHDLCLDLFGWGLKWMSLAFKIFRSCPIFRGTGCLFIMPNIGILLYTVFFIFIKSLLNSYSTNRFHFSEFILIYLSFIIHWLWFIHIFLEHDF